MSTTRRMFLYWGWRCFILKTYGSIGFWNHQKTSCRVMSIGSLFGLEPAWQVPKPDILTPRKVGVEVEMEVAQGKISKDIRYHTAK